MPDRLDPRAISMLERLLEWSGADLPSALTRACNLVAESVGADKVDAFLHDADKSSLVALGVSDQPLSRLQRKLGLDVLQLANRGRIVEAFMTGQAYATGRLDQDPHELLGTKEGLGVRSLIAVPLSVDGARRGVLAVAWKRSDAFVPEDVGFVSSVSRWVGVVAHRADLVDRIAQSSAEQGRQTLAEELITGLAHDLRNHLQPIELRFAVLRQRAARDGRERDVADCDAGVRVVNRLRRMISSILDVARLDRGLFELEREVVDLGGLVRDVGALMSAPDHPISVEVGGPVNVRADAERLRQVLENLVTNAMQHSPTGAPVLVRLTERGDHACIEVCDEGGGIPSEIRPKIFERFVTGRSGGGLGLGLYMAKTIARLHDGDLQVAASGSSGSRFVLSLPRSAS